MTKRILIIDDSREKRDALGKELRKRGFEVILAEDVERAADLLTKNAIDFAVVDGDLGDMDFGPEGVSGRFIKSHLAGIPYGRFSLAPTKIPRELHGEFCTSNIFEIIDWFES